jgi:hypothetical protein
MRAPLAQIRQARHALAIAQAWGIISSWPDIRREDALRAFAGGHDELCQTGHSFCISKQGIPSAF